MICLQNLSRVTSFDAKRQPDIILTGLTPKRSNGHHTKNSECLGWTFENNISSPIITTVRAYAVLRTGFKANKIIHPLDHRSQYKCPVRLFDCTGARLSYRRGDSDVGRELLRGYRGRSVIVWRPIVVVAAVNAVRGHHSWRLRRRRC